MTLCTYQSVKISHIVRVVNASSRRVDIAERLRVEGEALIGDLARRYGTSEMTIRRDLDYLESEGLARRSKGGAIFLHNRVYEPPVHQRAALSPDAKAAIGRAAAAMVRDDEAVILDIGTTTGAMAQRLRPDLCATVVTHSLLIANELSARPTVRTILTGGTLRAGEMALAGPQAIDAYRRLHCDVIFLGIAGIDVEAGLTEGNEDDATVKRAALAAARRVVVLADASKLGRVTFATVAPVSAVDTLVTDARPDHPVVERLAGLGVEVVHVEAGASEGE